MDDSKTNESHGHTWLLLSPEQNNLLRQLLHNAIMDAGGSNGSTIIHNDILDRLHDRPTQSATTIDQPPELAAADAFQEQRAKEYLAHARTHPQPARRDDHDTQSHPALPSAKDPSSSPSGMKITTAMAEAAGRMLAHGVCMDWDGLEPGTAKPQYRPWIAGAHRNARQGDYIELGARITQAALTARTAEISHACVARAKLEAACVEEAIAYEEVCYFQAFDPPDPAKLAAARERLSRATAAIAQADAASHPYRSAEE